MACVYVPRHHGATAARGSGAGACQRDKGGEKEECPVSLEEL